MAPKAPFQRTKTGGGFLGVNGEWDSYDRFTCLPGKFHQGTYVIALSGFQRSQTDVVTPGFRKLSREGKVVNNPRTFSSEAQTASGTFSRVRSVAESCGATHVHNEEDLTGPHGWYYASGTNSLSLPRTSLITDEEISSAVGVAATQAWEKSNGHLADILVDVAEMRQTLKMFTQPTSAIKPLLSAINRTRKGGLNAFGKVGDGTIASARNLWLQYRYGVRPLVSSVNGILKALNKPPSSKRQTFRGKYSLFKQGSTTGTTSTWSTRFNWEQSASDVVNIRAGILMEETLDLPTTLGVDGSGLLSLPWELVPFSFVADWFINVGSFIGGLVPYLTKHPLATWYSVDRTRATVWKITSTTAVNPASYTIVRPAQELRTATFVDKVRYPILPMPSIRLKPQALQNVFSDLRGLDAAALAMQQLGRVFK
jgi:hypothetical protein